MKTLYGILGVQAQASTDQIETAYALFSARLRDNAGQLPADEIRNQTVAINEAYRTLTNPILRQRYDQKLLMAEAGPAIADAADGSAREGRFGLKTIGLIGLLSLAAIYFYHDGAKQREKLRIAHEHEVQMKAVQIAEDRQRQAEQLQVVVVERAQSSAQAQQMHQAQQQFERDSERNQRLELERQRLEFQQQQQLKRDEENRARQEQQQRQQRLQSEKRLLQQMERDRYGKVITY